MYYTHDFYSDSTQHRVTEDIVVDVDINLRLVDDLFVCMISCILWSS